MTWILSIFSTYKNTLTIGLGIVLCVACVLGGYTFASRKWEAKYAVLERSIAVQTAKEQEKYAEKLSVVLSERDSAISKWTSASNDRNRLIERLRVLESSRSKDSNVSDSVKPYKERLEGCRKLLLESAELVDASVGLVVKISADKDALAKLVEQK